MVAPNVKAETMRLMDQRTALEAEMDAIIAALSAPGGPGITGGLVDAEVQWGLSLFPRTPNPSLNSSYAPSPSLNSSSC